MISTPNTKEPVFSYTDESDSKFKYALIQVIEILTGRVALQKKYNEARQYMNLQNICFWEAAIQALRVDLDYVEEQVANFPKEGPLVVIANHPFGVVDGLMIGYLVNKVRPDFKIMTNSALCQAKDLAPYLLPVDFAPTKAAKEQNLLTRKNARQQVEEGKCLVLFPAGGVSTTKGFRLKATDFPWQVFTSELVHCGKASVVPIFFHGQNSILFQWVSQVSMTLRLALLIHEAHNKTGKKLKIDIGNVIPYSKLTDFKRRNILTNYLREITYGLNRELVTK